MSDEECNAEIACFSTVSYIAWSICHIGALSIMTPSRASFTRLLSFLILFTFSSTLAVAQRDVNIWYFGNLAGLDFNIPPATTASPAEVTTSAMNAIEGSALVTDRTTGQLLFYTQGIQVFDRNNTPMPAATGANQLGGGPSSTQAALTVPDLANPDRYFIFTTPDLGGGPAEFSIVDMTLRGGLGDVPTRRQALPTLGGTPPPQRVCEKVIATRDAAGTGFWVLFHEFTQNAAGSNAIYAYHLSATGIDAVRVSNVGTPIGNTTSFSRGEMKISPDGTWLATANENQVCELFRFNNSTGAVTLVTTLDNGQQHYGVSFSPNSRLLYINDGWNTQPRSIDQFNLANPTAAAILASRVEVGVSATGFLGGMQIAPDGRIYIAHNNANTLSVINCPNVAGVGCGFVDVGFTFTGARKSSWGMPSLILESVATPQFAGRDTAICLGESVRIGLDSIPGHLYTWSPDASLSSPNVARPIATPTTTTSYPIQITTPHGCIERDTITVTVNPRPTIVITRDTAICSGESIQLSASGGVTFQWDPVTDLSNPAIAAPVATPTATTTYTVRVTNATACVDSARVTITVNPKPTVDAGSDTAICDGDSRQLQATGPPGVSFRWSPGTGLNDTVIANPTATPSVTTTYTVVATNASGCSDTDVVTITVLPKPVASISADVTICEDDATILVASGGSTFRWVPGTGLSDSSIATPTARPATTTTYTVIVGNGAGCLDTASVTVTVNERPVAVVRQPFDTVCAGQSRQLSVLGGTSVTWSPPTGLSNPNVPDPIASPTTSTLYTAIVSNDNGCTDTATIDVVVITPSIRFILPDLVADPHTRGLAIPITMESVAEPLVCRPDSLTIEVEFNASLFVPRSVSNGTITRNQVIAGRRILGISFGADAAPVSGDLFTILGDVLLGDSLTTDLSFRSIKYTGLLVTTDSVNGSLSISPICVEGGNRLLDFGDEFGVAKIVPNPAGREIAVEVRTVELGSTRLVVYSSGGDVVALQEWVATQSAANGGELRRIPLPPDLPSGLYQVVLQTPARRDAKPLIIVK